jgi:hypothetical protein
VFVPIYVYLNLTIYFVIGVIIDLCARVMCRSAVSATSHLTTQITCTEQKISQLQGTSMPHLTEAIASQEKDVEMVGGQLERAQNGLVGLQSTVTVAAQAVNVIRDNKRKVNYCRSVLRLGSGMRCLVHVYLLKSLM